MFFFIRSSVFTACAENVHYFWNEARKHCLHVTKLLYIYILSSKMNEELNEK